MPLHLDHVVIAVHDLDAAIHRYRAMGFTIVKGGVHANRATQNALITFADETYLELLASTGESPLPDLIDFSVLLPAHNEETPDVDVAGFALRSDDLAVDLAQLREAGFTTGEVVPGERRREDSTIVRWALAQLDDGFAPFAIQDVTPRNWRISGDPALTTHMNKVVGLHNVAVGVYDLDAVHARYANVVGVRLHEVASDQPIGPFAVQVTLADGSTRDLNQFEQDNIT